MEIVFLATRKARPCFNAGALVFAALCIVFVQACSPSRVHSIQTQSAANSDPSVIYDRANQTFAKAVFWKPKESADAPIDITLAPLIVQEVTDNTQNQDFGRVWRNAWHIFKVDTTKPTVYTFSFPQWRSTYTNTYFLWRYPKLISFGWHHVPETRGVRVMAGSDGLPLVWQPLSSRNKQAPVFFVSAGLEKAAREQFGEPLPGRHFAIEKGLDDPNAAIVARTIEDSPVPMGPYVYLTAGDQTISTVFCRCMPSQVNEFVETKYYELSKPAQMNLEYLGDYILILRLCGDARAIDLTRGDELSNMAIDPHEHLRWPDGF